MSDKEIWDKLLGEGAGLLSNPDSTFWSNVPIAGPPIFTAEGFKKTCDDLLKGYREGKYVIQPNYYPHVTRCCDKSYQSIGPCQGQECPWGCGAERQVEKWCALCQVMWDALNYKEEKEK